MVVLFKKYRRLFGTVIFGIMILGIAIFITAVNRDKNDSIPFESIFPEGVEVGFILALEDRFPDMASKKLLFDVNENGQPFFVIDDIFVGLKSTEYQNVGAFKISGLENLSNFAWMKDGALLAISDRKLGEVTTDGFHPIINLPATGMKIKPASADRCYLYDGNISRKKHEIYLYKKGGKILKLFQAPGIINAIAGDGDVTFIALGREIFALGWDEPLTPFYEAKDEVIFLEFYSPWGLFYSTAKGIGYVNERGKGYEFIRGQGGDLRVRGDDLYIFFQDSGDLLKCSPISRFQNLAQTLKKDK